MHLHSATRRPPKALPPRLISRALLIPTRLTDPATHAGVVDGTFDRHQCTARTIQQAFGPYASANWVEPMPERMPLGHRVANVVGILIGIGLVVWLAIQRFAA